MNRIRFFMPLAAFAVAAPAFAAMPQLPDRPVTRAEVMASVRKHFAAADANHDGYVSRAEFERYRQRVAAGEGREDSDFGRMGEKWFDKSDTNGDGRVSEAEAMARPMKLFDMADANGDGVVSVKEREMAMMMMELKK